MLKRKQLKGTLQKTACMLLCLCALPLSMQARRLHVSKDGSVSGDGSKALPLKTISQAADIAIAGDTVYIHGGTYREWVSPSNSGLNEARRIVYMAAAGEEVWVKGSEIVPKWKKTKNNIWRAEVSNKMFGDFNPYTKNIFGDWLQKGHQLHLGQVYIDGKGLTECTDLSKLPKQTQHWYAEVNDETTVFYIQVEKSNPNKALMEINVRPTCFFPKTQGLNYITVDGLHLAQAATQWSAPTSEQTGIIGPNWSTHWVIKNCEVVYSRCVGICIGKPRASGHNFHSIYDKKTAYEKVGFSRQIESVFTGLAQGWNKENVGSHVIEHNRIHDCGQAGLVGHMGCIFSTIKDNVIYNNGRNPLLGGAETAGIKLHAAIDTYIAHNYLYNNEKGLWLDWQAQGTQVYDNVMIQNRSEDVFVEVSHGPTMIYNNILLSNVGFRLNAQGIAFFNNLVAKKSHIHSSNWRYTPYHFPHSTKVKGLFNNSGGDARLYNNIFLGNGGKEGWGSPGLKELTCPLYDVHLTDSLKGLGALNFKFCQWTAGNVFLAKAVPSKHEENYVRDEKQKVQAALVEKADGLYFEWDMDAAVLNKAKTIKVHTDGLPITLTSECIFDNKDGEAFVLTRDFLGKDRNVNRPMPGPFKTIKGSQKVFAY